MMNECIVEITNECPVFPVPACTILVGIQSCCSYVRVSIPAYPLLRQEKVVIRSLYVTVGSGE